MHKKHICIIVPVFNEAGNITELYERVTNVMTEFVQYSYEIRVIDNFSTDGTREEIRTICAKDSRFKAIFNVRNFGPIRSPIYNLYHSEGDATIALCADLEDPPELIPQYLAKWEEGYKLVMGIRTGSEEKGIMPVLRQIFYTTMNHLSDREQLSGITGFGLYDKEVITTLRAIDDPYPYLRGLICELGWPIAQVPFFKPLRKRGISSYNFLRYYEEGMLGVVTQSRMPLHLITILGLLICSISFMGGLYYLILKLLNWSTFQIGLAPAFIGLFFLMGLLFMVIGMVGEYVGLIVTHVVKRPLIIEEERLNFSEPAPRPSIEAQDNPHAAA